MIYNNQVNIKPLNQNKMTPKEKAEELCNKMFIGSAFDYTEKEEFHKAKAEAKQCALIAVENEYNSLREMLFNLRSCYVIESEKVYLHRLQELIDEEQQVKNEIINL